MRQAAFLGLLAALLYAGTGGNLPGRGGLSGDPVAGGRIYDNWLLALDLVPPQGDQPLWERQDSNTRSGQVTWRCVECHGWDYKGAQGAYREGSLHYTGFPGLGNMVGASQEEVLAWLDGTNNPDHNFLRYTNLTALNDLAAFLRTRQVDMALIVDYDSGEVIGNQVNGAELYVDNCSGCHGVDGRQINFATGGSPIYLGDVAAVDPWHTIHTVRFGTPVRNMPSSEEMGWSLSNVADVVAYAQGLPRGNPNFAIFDETTLEDSIESQGEMEPIILGAAAILIVIALGLGWDALRQRAGQKAP